jgi:hypothetical protein
VPHASEGNGPVHGPDHSALDPEASYQLVAKYINPANLESSKIVVKGGNMHCLNDYGLNCQTTASDMLPLVKAWWDQGEKLCLHGLPIRSREIAIPKPLPDKKTGFAKVRLKLEEINADYKNLFFEFEIQRAADSTPQHPGSYLIQRPRFLSTNGNWRVRGLQFALNGALQMSADVFSSLDTLVSEIPSASFDDPVWTERVASVRAAIVIEDAASTDKIRVEFGEVTRSSERVECHDLEIFKTQVKPTALILGCQYCHGGDNRNPEGDKFAKARLDMSGDDASVCSKFVRQGQRKNIWSSPILWFPMHGRPIHPLVISSTDAVTPAWSDWLAKGI